MKFKTKAYEHRTTRVTHLALRAGLMAAGAMALLPQAMWAQNPMPAIIQAQNSEARIDRLAHRKPTSFNAPRAAGPLVSVAAERYVFGRVDLAAGEYPQGVAVGVFKTGGLQLVGDDHFGFRDHQFAAA